MTDIAKEIAGLDRMKTHELRERWRRTYWAKPPTGISRDLLIQALAYHIQEGELGDLSRAVMRRLRAIVQKMRSGGSSFFDLSAFLKPGAKLIKGTIYPTKGVPWARGLLLGSRMSLDYVIQNCRWP